MSDVGSGRLSLFDAIACGKVTNLVLDAGCSIVKIFHAPVLNF